MVRKKIHRDRPEPAFFFQVRKPVREIGTEAPEAEMLLRMRCGVRFGRADLRFKDRGDEKAQRVEQKQRGKADSFVTNARDRHHDRAGERIDEAGDRVRALIVSAADERRIKAVVGHGVHAVDAADEHGHQQKDRIVKISAAQQEIQPEKDRARKKIQRIDDPLSRKTVEVRPREERKYDARQAVAHHKQRVQEYRARVIEHEKADGKAGDGAAEHGYHRAERDDRKIACPERRHGLLLCLFYTMFHAG